MMKITNTAVGEELLPEGRSVDYHDYRHTAA